MSRLSGLKKLFAQVNALLEDLQQDKYSCQVCFSPGYATKNDNSDWIETHERGCSFYVLKKAMQPPKKLTPSKRYTKSARR